MTRLEAYVALRKKESDSPNKKPNYYDIPEFASWKEREAAARATAHVDYDCNFNAAGGCKTYPRGRQDSFFAKERPHLKMSACCVACSDSLGYLDVIPRGTALTMSALWDPLRGFWRERKGCLLPRKWRSYTCLAYSCSSSTVRPQLVQIGLAKLPVAL